jgi:hypothetical protein
MLAVLSAARAAAIEPGLSSNWTGSDLQVSADAGEAALADALRRAAGHRCRSAAELSVWAAIV